MKTDDAEIINIPIQFEGVIVGYATSNNDHHLEVKFTESSTLLSAWRETIMLGLMHSLQLGPVYNPGWPTTMNTTMKEIV